MTDFNRDYQRDVVGEACFFCEEIIEESGFGKALVHHADGDRTNLAPENLVAAHWGCHSRHHKNKGGQVHFRKGRGIWVARMTTVSGKRLYLGSAKTKAGALALLEKD